MFDERTLRRIVSLIDYTRLIENDKEADVIAFFDKANTTYGTPAAVCVYPQYVRLAQATFTGTPIKVASVANFPEGGDDLEAVLIEINAALEDGAREIDLVFPYQRYLAGDKTFAVDFVAACKTACDDEAQLKVILETGALQRSSIIENASRDVLLAGADFIKTSTGKKGGGATLEAATIMLNVIQDLRNQIQKPLGLKVSGGIKTVKEALGYVQLADEILGMQCVCPATFRIGASQLLENIGAKTR